MAAAVGRAGAADVVGRLADGLDTQLGPTWPGGVEVSFGQWQKLALARGFMRREPLLLVLDEPTAALDAETEHALFERYAAAARAGGGITLLVSHRFFRLCRLSNQPTNSGRDVSLTSNPAGNRYQEAGLRRNSRKVRCDVAVAHVDQVESRCFQPPHQFD